jgi:integrase/recombinase XerD
MDSSAATTMHAVRGYFRFAHIDGLIGSDTTVYARLAEVSTETSHAPRDLTDWS